MHGLKKKRGKEDKPYSSGKKKKKSTVKFCFATAIYEKKRILTPKGKKT